MKKTAIIFVSLTLNFSFLTFNCFAQPNAGFENWSSAYGIQEPDNWQTFNFLSLLTPPNPLSAFKATGIDKHSGNYALKLQTIYVTNNPFPTYIQDTMSGAFTGKINGNPVSFKYGFPYTSRPAKFEFWAKYIPVGNDAAIALVSLLKWNGTTHDTIASDKINIPATTAYTLFQDSLIYFLTDTPDSATIAFSSSFYSASSRVGSILYIDDVAFTGSVGIDQYDINSSKVKTFPNPAKDNITILAQIDEADNVQLTDAMGKLVGVYKIQNYTANVKTSIFAEGIYFYEIRDKKNIILTKGKFNVIK